MKKRIIEIIKTLGITQKEFAKNIGITDSGLTDYMKGRSNNLSSSTISNIVISFGVNSEWLLTGEGNMFTPSPAIKEKVFNEIPADKDKISDIMEHLDKKDIEYIANYVSLAAFKSGIDVSHIKKQKSLYKIKDGKQYQVPQIGRIAAGYPILAEENVEGYINIPDRLMPKNVNPKNLFALEVSGKSMINAGISSGDIVIMEKVISVQDQVRDGNIVAALIDNEATLKRIYCKNKKEAELRPDNPEFDPIPVTEKDFTIIQGRLIWVIKRFMDEEEGLQL